MLVYHAAWDMTAFGWVDAAFFTKPWLLLWRDATAAGFFLIAGLSCRLTRRPWRRAGITALAAVCVTAVGELVGAQMRFGALHLLAVCMALDAAAERLGLRLRTPVWGAAALMLFAVSAVLLERITVPVPWLFPLGLRAPDFTAADYYPLLPWGCIFWMGTCLSGRIPEGAGRPVPILSALGRRSLLIYLLHQPALLAALQLVYIISKR